MTQRIQKADERRLHRFLDGELDAPAQQLLRTRLLAEPLLQARLRELEAVRALFAADRGERPPAPKGFTSDVLAAVRQQTLEQGWRRNVDDDSDLIRLCRRILVAAALLFSLAAVIQSGLLQSRSSVVEAGPDRIRAECRRLDELISARARTTPAVTAPATRKPTK
jgi:anti-sigma factor RsiW